MPNLILSHRTGETILIGDDIEITPIETDGSQTRISIQALREARIVRAELKRLSPLASDKTGSVAQAATGSRSARR